MRTLLIGLSAAALTISASTARAVNPPASQPGQLKTTAEMNQAFSQVKPDMIINGMRTVVNMVNPTDEQKTKLDAVFGKALEDMNAAQADATAQPMDKMREFAERTKQLKQEVIDSLDGVQKEQAQKLFGGGGVLGGPRPMTGGPTSRPAIAPADVTARLTQFMDALDLSTEQRAKINDAAKNFQDAIAEVTQAAQNGKVPDDLRQKAMQAGMEYRKQVMSVLTDEQKAKLQEMFQSRAGANGGPPSATPDSPTTQPAR